MKFAGSKGGAVRLQPNEPAAQDGVVGLRFPATVEWLTVRQWEDGSKRQTGTVMVLAEDGVWKAWLHDRDGARSCWLSAGGLIDLAALIELTLETGEGSWRPDRSGGKR